MNGLGARTQRMVIAAVAAVLFHSYLVCPIIGQTTGSPDLAEIQPLIPPGISDFNLEVFGKLAYSWREADQAHVVEMLGNFTARMGPYKLSSRDAVIWLTNQKWRDKPYITVDVFLWQGAEILQPAGTVERGPALIVTLRTFGKFMLNADGHAASGDQEGELFKEATKARRLLTAAPPAEAEKAERPVQVAPTAEQLAQRHPKPARQVSFTARDLRSEQVGEQQVIIAINEVMVSQGSPAESGEYVEIHADAAVLYLRKDKVGENLPGLLGGEESGGQKKVKPGDLNVTPAEPSARTEPKLKGRDKSDREAMKEWVQSVYLEGDVLLSRGQRMIRASKLYYDFETEQALILDPVMRALDASGKVPIYVRAEKVRQLSATQYQAQKAQFTTSEFHTPHSSIGATKLELTDRTPRNETGQIAGIEAGTYKAYHTTLNLEGLPIAYWPFSSGDFSKDRMAFRGVKFGYNGDFGWTAETRWYLFNLLGLDPPPGTDATLTLDYFTDRGPGVGVDGDYQNENSYGLVNTYYIHDQGKDELGPERSGKPPHEDRGRATWRHRQYLPMDLELTVEASYVSDRNFLEQYERREFENGKDQETLAQLLKRKDNWQVSTLLNYRINEFQTQTEHLPDTMFSLIGEPLGEWLTLYSESRAGVVRYRFDENSEFGLSKTNEHAYEDTGSVLRGDTREELRVPVPKLGPLKLTPYVAGRAGAYDDGPESRYRRDENSFGRVFGSYGVTGNMLISKVDDSIESRFLDLHRLRHVIKPDFTLWNAHANRNPDQMTPFDSGVEDISDAGGGTMGLRQRFQTQRGGPGNWRTVDWIIFDVEGGFFDHKQSGENTHGDFVACRPEDSISSNFIATNFQYRLSDSTVVVYDNVFDTNRGNLGTSNLSIAVEREPRLAYFAGWRYIHDTDSNLLAFGGNYKLSEKHTVGLRELYDIEVGRNYSTELIYVRRWPRWYTAVALDVDRTLNDVGLNFSIWPEGSPRMGLGSKRYTGLADSMGVRAR